MRSRAREEKDNDSHGKKGIATKNVEGRKKALFVVEGAPLQYTREMGNVTTKTLRSGAHHVNVWEQAMRFGGGDRGMGVCYPI